VASTSNQGNNCVVAGSAAGSANNGTYVYGSEMQVSLPFVINVKVQ
jgi:hypothetical protein